MLGRIAALCRVALLFGASPSANPVSPTERASKMNFAHALTYSKPRMLLIALAIVAAFACIAFAASGSARASGGGVSASGDGGGGDGTSSRQERKYNALWDDVSTRNKRWARKTAECESGGDPNAIGGGGKYRGAFQFMKSTWRTSPKSPGGDPIRYSYRTQAVVAVALKHRDGAGAWPVCG